MAKTDKPDDPSRRPQDEVKRGTIRHVTKKPSLGIEMLRLERKLKPIIDKWHEAMRRDPKAWK